MLAGVLIAALFGLIIGSFLNALVWRVHVGRSIAKGRSVCPNCDHVLAATDLVPVLSWILLGGKCRYCHKPISIQYPAVEALTALVFALSYYAIMPVGRLSWVSFGVWLVVLAGLVFLTVYDLRWLLLPDAVQLPLLGLVAAWLIGVSIATHSVTFGWHHLVAALIGGAVFYALASLAKGNLMGGGDVKLIFIMGLLLGMHNLLVALVISFNVAAIIGISLMIVGKKGRRDPLPFGPFLALGTVTAFLYGESIVNWYLRLNGVA